MRMRAVEPFTLSLIILAAVHGIYLVGGGGKKVGHAIAERAHYLKHHPLPQSPLEIQKFGKRTAGDFDCPRSHPYTTRKP